MPRRTKAESEATREALLDAAEQVFYDKGVARASLEEIARAAGLTRGAFYWHFRDKAELFRAILSRVWLPFEELVAAVAEPKSDPHHAPDVLETLRLGTLAALARAEQPQSRRVHAIILHRCGIFADIDPVTMVREMADSAFAETLSYFQQAEQEGKLCPGLDAATANWLLHTHVRGLIYTWHLDPDAFQLVVTGSRLVNWLFGAFAGAPWGVIQPVVTV